MRTLCILFLLIVKGSSAFFMVTGSILRRIPACQFRTRVLARITFKRRFFSFSSNSSSILAFNTRATSNLTCSSIAMSCTDWCTYVPNNAPVPRFGPDASRDNLFFFFFSWCRQNQLPHLRFPLKRHKKPHLRHYVFSFSFFSSSTRQGHARHPPQVSDRGSLGLPRPPQAPRHFFFFFFFAWLLWEAILAFWFEL